MLKCAARTGGEPGTHVPTRLPNQAVLALPLVALEVLLLGAIPPKSCKWDCVAF